MSLSSTLSSAVGFGDTRQFSRLDRLARTTALTRLRGLENGRLTIRDAVGTHHFGRGGETLPVEAVIHVRDPRLYRMTALGGQLGAFESYLRGHWDCDDLTALVRIFVRNRATMEATETGFARVSAPVQRLIHVLRRNTTAGSRRNIAAHYDMGNAFFRLFLDDTMTYSCGIFERPDSTLRDASIAKYERVGQKLQLGPTDHVLEIGGGWGGFAVHAAKRYGCRITTATISREQHAYARRRIAQAGLQDRVDVVLRDYRLLSGHYDKIVSIEMIEAVGHHYYDRFFAKCSDLLAPDGMMLLQAITLADQYYAAAIRGVDFIKRYIFPGSCIPSVTALTNSVTRATDMRLVDLDDITVHYATTLRRWYENFIANRDRVAALGMPERFLRMWELYLCYCEAGFTERYLGDVQMLLSKPLCRRDPVVRRIA